MTHAVDPIAGLRARLAGGVLDTVRKGRLQADECDDCQKFDDYFADEVLPQLLGEFAPADLKRVPKFSEFTKLLKGDGFGRNEVDQFIDALAALLGSRRSLLIGVLFSPHLLLDRIPRLLGESAGTEGSWEKCWTILCWISEAAWRCIQSPTGQQGPASGIDRKMLAPLAARLRFLVLSEPMRHRADTASPWLSYHVLISRADKNLYGLYELVFGKDSWFILMSRCREARWNWQAQLDAYQSAPLLAQAKPSEIEEELGLLVFRTGRAGPPLVLSPEPLTESVRVSADDQAVITEAVERHFLPRFQLGRVMALVTASPSPAWRSVLWAAFPLVPLVAAFALAAAGRFTVAAQAALSCYALIGLGALLGGARVAAPWLLRIPAASALGLLVLIALHPTWWNSPKGGWGTPAALLTLSFGYLVVEARNHGVEAVRAVLRAAVVTVIGVLHAVLVALIGLLLIAPAYAERPDNGPRIADWFASGDTGRSWYLLLLAAAWCLVAGVFSQILWEDRPITASLAHVGWRSGR